MSHLIRQTGPGQRSDSPYRRWRRTAWWRHLPGSRAVGSHPGQSQCCSRRSSAKRRQKIRLLPTNLSFQCWERFAAVGGRGRTDLWDVGRCRDGEGLSVESEGDFRHALDVLAVHCSLREERHTHAHTVESRVAAQVVFIGIVWVPSSSK